MSKHKVEALISATLELGDMPSDKAKQASRILSRYLRLKSFPTNPKEGADNNG